MATSPSISMQQNRSSNRYLVLIISSKKGHIGIRINKMCSTFKDDQILDGGPIEYGLAFHLIHTHDFNTPETSTINDQISITRMQSVEHIKQLQEQPKAHIVVNGYMAWIKGQLEEEIINGLWIPIAYNHEILFKTDVNNRWRSAYKVSGITPEFIGLYDAHL